MLIIYFQGHTHAQVTTKRRASSGALKQIQVSNTENPSTAKTGSGGTGNEGEIRKRTYTVSQERRSSVFEIPDVDAKMKCNDGNGKETKSVLQRDKSSLYSESAKYKNPPVGKQFESDERECETIVQITATERENKTKSLAPSCKFTFCGKTLHLENVSSHDSIYSHMEALRMYLEKELGTRLLTAVYRYVTNVSLEEHERIKRTVTAMLGEDNMTYFPVLLQLVACESIYFH